VRQSSYERTRAFLIGTLNLRVKKGEEVHKAFAIDNLSTLHGEELAWEEETIRPRGDTSELSLGRH